VPDIRLCLTFNLLKTILDWLKIKPFHALVKEISTRQSLRVWNNFFFNPSFSVNTTLLALLIQLADSLNVYDAVTF
jgi:hypothetical protein